MINKQYNYKNVLKDKANHLAHQGYDLTFKFPKEELYCLTSQLRRSLISVPSNIIEGYSRNNKKEFLHFMKFSYASLSEAKYQMNFAIERGYITNRECEFFLVTAEEVSKMLWSSMDTLRKNIDSSH
ncbi:MAG: four helix bundle protein [Bacteroidales bacterium]|nr:four helix bundle protein [Bacteroidales bacterium]